MNDCEGVRGTICENNRLRELSVSDRPQERLERLGPSAVSDAELLALLLRSGTRGTDVVTLSHRLLNEAGSLARLVTWRESEFKAIRGIGPVKALQLVAVMEIARRIIAALPDEAPVLGRAELVADHFSPLLVGLEVEKFWVLCLNRKNRLLKRVEVTSGTATNSLVHPREVFRCAIREGAAALICAHNHPSGDPTPSAADIQVTRQLREAAKTVCIDLLDHVILGKKTSDPSGQGFYSFRAAGLL
ncbi:hypothetical protein DB347_07725 [Opitutaceae bacterium EW11]|nr:hypothetical protein DB347_07725 [Opitutaceae bacterium EW11]